MAPQNKPMPTSSSMRSPLDPRYAEGMSNLYEGMKKAAAQGLFSQTDVKRNFDQFKRVIRVLFSQGDNFVTNYFQNADLESLANAEGAKNFSTKVYNQLSKEPAQQAMNYAPGIIEGHHPVSVESTFEAGRHLIDQGRWDDFFEFQRYLNNEYGVGGTVAESMYPLTKFAHQWKGGGTVDKYGNPKKPSPIPSAHTTPNPWTLAESEGFPVEMTWGKEYDYSGINDPRELGDVFMRQAGFPQIMMADKAMDSPQEIGFRTELAQKLGIRERDLYTLIKKRSDSSSTREFDFNAPGARIKQLLENAGITKDDVAEMAHRAYGLPVPATKAALPSDPNAPKVPRAKKDKVLPTFEDAESFAKGWFTESDFLPEQGTLIEPNPPSGAALKTLGKAASVLPGVGAVLDVGDVFAGTQQVMGSQSKPQQVVGGLRAASGALGLASLAAPVLAPAALAISGVSALADRRLAADTAGKPDVSVSGKPARVIPTRQMPPSKPIGTGQGGVTKPMGAMPSTKPLDIRNEAQYFIVNPIRSAYDRIFGKRDI
jgi:hypothetical protein